MNGTTLARWLGAWVAVTVIASLVVHAVFAMRVDQAHPLAVIATVWAKGQVVARAVVGSVGETNATLDAALQAHPGATRVDESVVGEAPVLLHPEALMAVSFVPGRDGVKATVGDLTAYVTPDELLARQAYDKDLALPNLQLTVGVDVPLVVALLSERLGVPAPDVLDRATVRRVRVVRTTHDASRVPTPEDLTTADAKNGALAAARYLARGVDDEGRFRYLVDAPTNRTLPGYDWPRHAGATYFLARAASTFRDGSLASAALRAASLLRDRASVRCGDHRCIGNDRVVDVGSAALAVLAFVEIARDKLDPSYAQLIPELTAFLRSQQRPDGEFMHLYDRQSRAPRDVQLLYYSGEAAFALARAHALLGNPADLAAATRAVSYLVHDAWSFFGGRYYQGEEHWTCQAMADLWDRAPSNDALDFCLRWAAYGRTLMYGPGDSFFDADGAYGFGPVVTPRLTPAGSRAEAGIATLEVGRRAGRSSAELAPLELQMRRSLAMLLRHQFGPREAYLLADPAAVEGGFPGTEVDWAIRIDYEQHAGCALLRWLTMGVPAADRSLTPVNPGGSAPERAPSPSAGPL